MKLESQINLIYQLLIYLKIKISKKIVEQELQKHPFRFTLLAISDLLSNFYISNAAYQVKTEELYTLPLPIIVHTATEDFICIIEFKDNKAVCLTTTGTTNQITLEKLSENFTGTVLTIDDCRSAGFSFAIIRLWADKLKISILITIITLAISAVFIVRHASASSGLLVLFIEIMMGLTAAVLLIIQSLDKNNELVRQICGVNSKLNCNHILSSPQASLTSFLNLSECCLFYFSGSLAFLLSSSHEASIVILLFITNVLSLPFTFYSFFHQKKMKGWCLLCCIIALLLWIEVYTLWPVESLDLEMINSLDAIVFGMSFALPITIWIIVKPLIAGNFELKKVKNELNTFKYNERIFQQVLSSEKKYELINEEYAVVLGKKDSANIITIVSNPFCKPCAEAHSLLDHWLKTGLDFKLQVVFAIKGNDEKGKEFSADIYSIYRAGNEDKTQNAIHDWFTWGTENFHKWNKRYSVQNDKRILDYTIQQNYWINHVNIQYTPTVFINGAKIPELYQLKDIHYMFA